jgi:hypothetical protein
MKRFGFFVILVFLVASTLFAQHEIYKRTLIDVPAIENTGFGNFVAGVDLDGDGKLEVYAVNNNWNDSGNELIPRIYKFEQNGSGGWDLVWSATMPIPLQNTWPTICVADLDGDGRKEVVWGPVNFTDASTNPNPARIIVFESIPGSDTLGVPDGSGGFKPNTQWTMTATASANIRPFKLQAWDFNHDGKSELVFSDRANSIYRFGVVGVNAVPDNGDTTGVVWSYKYEGLVSNTNINVGTYYDFAIVDSTIFFINTNGNVQPVSYANGTYTLRATQLGLVPGGSWKTSAVVDLDGAGSKEIIVTGWTATAANKKIHIFQKATDSTLTEATAIDISGVLGTSGQAYGGAVGDIDNDGKPDYVFGSRDASAKVFRLEYQGGGISTSSNYTVTEIDRSIVTTATRLDEFAMANVDGKAGDEVFYSNSVDGRVPIVVLSDGGKAVNVTFNVNTSGIPDTLKTNSYVHIRGGSAQLTWDNTSPTKMTNIGGDYWKFTGLFKSGDTIPYKYFTNVKPTITGSDNGWEADTKTWGTGNRRLIVGQADTTLPLEYANGFNGTTYQQWDAPFPNTKTDTVVMYLRVNMQSAIQAGVFDPTKHKVGVRGSFTAADWGTSFFLSKGTSHANGGQTPYDGGNFYTIPIYFNKTAIQATPFNVAYKFIIHNIDAPANEGWDKLVSNVESDRGNFAMPLKDTTIAWVWYNNAPYIPPVGKDTATVKFRVDMAKAIADKGFAPGDTIYVRYGYNSTADQTYTDTLKLAGFGTIYETTARQIYKVNAGKNVLYQYYIFKRGTESREVFYDFEGGTTSDAERRKFVAPANKGSITVADTVVSATSMRRKPTFPNTSKLSQNVAVTFTCDLRPAYYTLAKGDSLFDVQGAFRDLGQADKDSVFKWGVWINGPAVGGWGNPSGGDWGVGLRTNLSKKMYDDGTHGDVVAGDSIYSLTVMFYKDSANNTVGQVFKFGLNAGDNEGGKGGFGNNHVRNIDDASSTATIAEAFGSINPAYYNWDYITNQPKTPLGVNRDGEIIPSVYALEQNYPNPFNPTTSIKYSIPVGGQVTLKIYNILGQEVLTLVNENLQAGSYTATFNASNLSSGTYIYRIHAGTFTAVKKMMLLK